jgi:Na+(H+)/acetate symporter ActP
MRARLVATLIAVVAGLQLLPAATVSYDIVYVRGP